LIPEQKNKIYTGAVATAIWIAAAAGVSMENTEEKGLNAFELANKPRLLLILTIDQARSEYMDRFRPIFTGGLKYILDKGVFFTDAHHHHAVTATGPGHASMATGLYPAHSGVIANQWYDRESGQRVNCVQDSDSPIIRPDSEDASSSSSSSSGRSPRNLSATALPDWIKGRSPETKIFTASGKDRSAILTGGKSADAAFWYDGRTGQFVTSQYYMKEYPPWMKRFHERKIADSYFGKPWQPLPVDPSLLEQLEIQALDRGDYHWAFPHPIGGASLTPTSSFYDSLYSSPFLDSYLAELAKTIVDSESLGKDEHLDVLGLCFSSVDTVGHQYGPNSPEILDTFQRLDRSLGELFQFLDDRIGMEHVVIALGADHGALPLPEYLKLKGKEGKRFSTEDITCYQQAEAELDSRFGSEDWLLRGLYLNYEAIGRRNLKRQEVETALANTLGRCSAVEKVWTRTELESTTESTDPYFEMYKHNFHPERSPDLFVQVKQFHLSRLRDGTTHGSPYPYDSHVPLVVVFPGIIPGSISERVYTVDLAPTVASLLGIPVPGELDGADRSGLLTQFASPATTR
jgi:predicted AlkP superfamily pyrophosphatase or phosphodiesterase